MNNKLHKFIHSLPCGVLAAGMMALVTLAIPARAQFVSTAISNVLNQPYGVTTDGNNNVYVTDSANNRIIEYVPIGGNITTLATGFNQPEGIVYSPGRNALVVADQANQVLRLVTLTGSVSTLAGIPGQSGAANGNAIGQAQFYNPSGVAVANDGASIYIADTGNNAIRLLSGNAVSTIATTYLYNGVAYNFRSPSAVAVDSSNNVWVADTEHDVICVISNGTPNNAYGIAGYPSSVGTNDSTIALNARFKSPSGLFWDNVKNLLVISDTLNDTIRTLFVTNGAYATATVSGTPGKSGYVDGGLGAAQFFDPIGICVDSNASGYFVVDQGNNAVRVLQPTQPPPPPVQVPNPAIGYVTFPVNNGTPEAQFNPITQQISIFNNVPVLAIEQLDTTVETYLNYGPTSSGVTPPGPTNGTSKVFTAADSGTLPDFAFNYALNLNITSNITLDAISEAPNRPSSDAVSAQIQFITANPDIVGQDAAAITLFDSTTNAQMWYTLDGTAPVPGATNTFPQSATVGITSGQIISFVPVTNTVLSVQAYFSNSTESFAPSGIVTAQFTTNSYQTDQMTFGFASGEASSKFLTAPGQTFIAPVTMSLIPTAETMYTLQFNLAVTTNPASGNTAAVTTTGSNALTFSSMLMQQFPGPVYYQIPAAMVGGLVITAVTNTNTETTNYFTNGALTNLVFTNIITNSLVSDLLGVGWIERPPATNLYNTKNQTLITYSIAHDTVFLNTGQQVVVGAFSFQVPTTATNGAQYEIQIGSPSATSDGISTPVVINVVSNGSLTNGAINSTKIVTVTTNQYLVGDVAPFSWFNAGDFGDNYLENNDVTETFQAAVYNLDTTNSATVNSDYFDAMDSSNGTTNNQYNPYSDAVINQILFGDHVLAVDDVWVTYRRSLDPGLVWVYRSDTSHGKVAITNANLIPIPFNGAVPSFGGAAGQAQVTNSGPRYISVAADQIVSGGNLSVAVPVRVLAADTLPITVMMLRVEVDPLDGSPPITEQVGFTPNNNLGQPFATTSQFTNDIADVWLNESGPGVAGTGILGNVIVPLPSNVTPNSAYLVHFDHFSASPNGFGLFHAAVQDGLITVSDRSASSWGDGIPDSWRLLWFGSISNAMSAADLDPDGDGANNWQEYVAGTNPNSPTSVFRFMPGACTPSTSAFTLTWSSVVNKSYTIECSYNPTPGNWTTLATNILGTGQIMRWTDSNAAGKAEYYRALVH